MHLCDQMLKKVKDF